MHRYRLPVTIACLVLACFAAQADPMPGTRTVNNGQMVMEGVPPIPAELRQRLHPYQEVRSAQFLDWTGDNRLLVRTRFSNVDQLHQIHRAGGSRRQLTFGREPVRAAASQPGGRFVAYTSDEGGDEFDQVFLLDLESGRSRRLTAGQGRNQALLWSGDGKRLVFQSTRRNGTATDLWVAEGEQLEQVRLLLTAPSEDSWWLPLDFSPDNERMLVQQFRSVTDARIHEFDLVSGRLSPVAGDGTTSNAAALYDRAGTGVFFITNQGGGAAELAWQPLDDPGDIEIITRALPWDVSQFALSGDGRRGAFVTNEAGISRMYLFSPREHYFSVVQGIPTGVIGPMSFSEDRRRLAFTLSTAQTPGDVFVLNLSRRVTEARSLERWSVSEVGGLNTSQFILPEILHYPTFDADGDQPRQVPAFLYRPKGNGPFPVVLWIHGGPESQFRPGFNGTIQTWLAELGVAVIAPNVRGSLGYGSRYASLDNGRLREDAVRDVGALLDWVAQQDYLDADRVAIYGGSYGGYMALASAIHYGDRLRAVVDRVGISHFVTFLEGTQDYRRDVRRLEYGDERDPEMRAFLEQISPLTRASDIRVPLLVAQGRNDPRVPWTESRQLVDAVRANGQPVWYLEAQNEGHGYRRRTNRDLWQLVVVMFLQQHLLVPASPSE